MSRPLRGGAQTLLVAACLLVFWSASIAASHPLSTRVSAGVNTTWLAHPDDHVTERSSGRTPWIGVFVQRQQTSRCAVEAGVVMESRRATWLSPFGMSGKRGDDPGFAHELHMAYFSIPLRIRACGAIGAVDLSVHTGLQLSYLAWARHEVTDRRSPSLYLGDRTVRTILPSSESAALFGGRVGTRVLDRILFLESTYVHGLRSSAGGMMSGEGRIPRFRNRVFMVGLGVLL